ncbi:MAG: MarR family transcriptional regulator [Desulfovibrionaceae bacterium]|nr:MarR family transcriptional regulator [Desulfovibrionaceae bacterium]
MTGRDDPLEESLGRDVVRLARALMRLFNRRLAAAGAPVTGEQCAILFCLFAEDGLTQSELCRRLVQDKTGVSRLVDGLERRGLAIRVRDRADRRHKRVHLTGAGRALWAEAEGLAREVLEESQRGLGVRELELCKDLLRRVFANLEAAG